MKTIRITVSGAPRDLRAEYLAPGPLQYWQAWITDEARVAYNPFAEFAAKVSVLSPELQAVATAEFTRKLDFSQIPEIVFLTVARSLRAVQTLCLLVTGEDVIDESNYIEAFPILVPWVQRKEITANSIAEVNRLRAEAGKPPIGSAQPPSGG